MRLAAAAYAATVLLHSPWLTVLISACILHDTSSFRRREGFECL